MGATNGFPKVSWKPGYASQEDMEKLTVAPTRDLKSAGKSSHMAFENQFNTTARGLRKSV
jgi:hypothetical protein